MTATYTKLNDGSWGVRCAGTAKPGAITVTKRDGTSQSETIARVLWTGRDSKSGQTISLCSIGAARTTDPSHRHPPYGHGYSGGSGCSCTEQGCCRPRCQCGAECNCRGGNIYNC